MFSKRTSWDLKVNRITELLNQYLSNAENIINLTESNPTLVDLNYSEKILKPLNNLQNLIYSPDPKGLIGTRESICRYYEQKGIDLNPEDLVLTSGSSEAYNYIFRLITEPGDEILVPAPSYPLLSHLSQINDIVLKSYRLIYDGEWHIDFDSMKKSLSPKTKILICINPNNPTGSYVKRFEYEKVIKMAIANNLIIVSDEVFWDYKILEDTASIISFSNCQEVPNFTINGISKLLVLPQMKLGWIIINGPADFKKEALNRIEIISDTFLSVNIPSQNALSDWFYTMNDIHYDLKRRIKENYNFLVQKINSDIPVQLFNIEGGWNAILRLPNIYKDEQWVEMFLNDCGVYVHPGYFYDFEYDSCIVLSLIVSPHKFQKGIEKLIDRILISSI
ncbi:MAG: putative aminotransferase [Ignavibacteriae bacterium]|nr:MAG: putative aminotransferase [Ignavibacteriota bacterium]